MRIGFSFGLTSGVITTLGLLVGLSRGTSSRTAVLAGILTIAVADALSDAMGIHVSEEGEGVHTGREVWTSTLATFVSKLAVALTFAVPVLLLPLGTATVAAVVWGAALLAILSVVTARDQGVSPPRLVVEHLGLALLVVAGSYLVGLAIDAILG